MLNMANVTLGGIGGALCFAVWLFFFVMLLEILLLSVCWLVVRTFYYCLCVGCW